MNLSAHNTDSLNHSILWRFPLSVFTGHDPRKGWRIPLNRIKYNEQRDEETGYGYFGARYMDHELMTMWLSVDPMSDKYPSISPYAYCACNSVKLVDPDGREVDDPEKKKKLESVNDKNKKNISEISWGETSGLYPTKNGGKIPNYENPVNWDEQKTEELMKARAAIHLIGTRRNTQVFRAKCTLKGIEKILAKYHLTSNFPPVDAEILNDKDVKFFICHRFRLKQHHQLIPTIMTRYV